MANPAPAGRSAPLIQIDGLSHRFADGRTGLMDVNLRIYPGETVVIAGANGSGKTTLLRHLNGLLRPTAGGVRLSGFRVSRHPARARRLVGMVFQDADSQIVGETVWEDAAFGPRNLKMPPAQIERRVRAILDSLGLAPLADRPPHLLSGGEKRRLALAGVLVMDPVVVAFDEPFAGLDYPGANRLLQEFARLKKNGRTLVITTHELERIVDLADRLVLMKNGRIVRSGAPADVLPDVEAFGVRLPYPLRTRAEKDPYP